MSVPFLTTSPGIDDLLLAVEVAWGADLTDLDGSGWTWDDISEYVVLASAEGEGGEEEGVHITIGRPDFSSETQTATMTCRLDNRDGRFSGGGLSPHWPHVRRGTPVRVRVSADGGDTWQVRFQGSAVGFTPQWDPQTGRWATVTLTASGPLRRLNQGTLPAKSAMFMGTMEDSSVRAYWPLEDQQQSKFLAPAIGGGLGDFRTVNKDGDTVAGVPGDFASYANVPSSAPMLTLKTGGAATLFMPGTGTTTDSSSTCSVIVGNWGGAPVQSATEKEEESYGVLFSVRTPDAASIKTWAVVALGEWVGEGWNDGFGDGGRAGPTLAVRGFDSDLATITSTRFFDPDGDYLRTEFSGWEFEVATTFTNWYPNVDYEIGLTLTQSGSTTSWTLWVNPCTVIPDVNWGSRSGSVSSNSNGARVRSFYLGPYSDMEGLSVGHAVIRAPALSTAGDEEWMRGYLGENPQERLERLCAGHGIAFELISTSGVGNSSVVDDLGPQYYDTLTNLLRECERTGQGLLFDGLGPGLSYVTKRRREDNASGAATLVLDAAEGHMMEPFAPVDDDQLTVNHCDVTRRNATTVSYMDRTGPVGAEVIGDYATSLTVNPETDDNLVHYAQWIVGIGTQTGYRYPSVSFALETNPELIDGWLACLPTSRIDVENITAIRRQHSPETIKLLVEGWQETITAFTWRITANTSPAAPWNIITAAAATGSTGDSVCHLDTDSSQLATSAAAGATSITVRTNSGPRWVTPGDSSAGGADNFPFALDVGGCRVEVTSISGTSTSGQTFTLASPGLPRAMTGSSTPGAGTPVKVWQPPVLGL